MYTASPLSTPPPPLPPPHLQNPTKNKFSNDMSGCVSNCNFIHCFSFISNLIVNYIEPCLENVPRLKTQSNYNRLTDSQIYVFESFSTKEYFERDSPMTRPVMQIAFLRTFSLWTPCSFQMTEQSGKYKTAIIGQNLALSFLQSIQAWIRQQFDTSKKIP